MRQGLSKLQRSPERALWSAHGDLCGRTSGPETEVRGRIYKGTIPMMDCGQSIVCIKKRVSTTASFSI